MLPVSVGLRYQAILGHMAAEKMLHAHCFDPRMYFRINQENVGKVAEKSLPTVSCPLYGL